jgi:hypothetical protein
MKVKWRSVVTPQKYGKWQKIIFGPMPLTLGAERLIFCVIHYINVPKKNCTMGTCRVLEDTAFFAVFKNKIFFLKTAPEHQKKVINKKGA